MTDLQRALEKVRGLGRVVLIGDEPIGTPGSIIAINRQLAALIEVAAEISATLVHGEDCEAWNTELFGQDYDDSKCDCGATKLSCALVGLVRAINGETT